MTALYGKVIAPLDVQPSPHFYLSYLDIRVKEFKSILKTFQRIAIKSYDSKWKGENRDGFIIINKFNAILDT